MTLMIFTVHLAHGFVQRDVSSDDSDVDRRRSMVLSITSSHTLCDTLIMLVTQVVGENKVVMASLRFLQRELMCTYTLDVYSLQFHDWLRVMIKHEQLKVAVSPYCT